MDLGRTDLQLWFTIYKFTMVHLIEAITDHLEAGELISPARRDNNGEEWG